MPTNITDSDTWEATVVGVADGDTANATTFNTPTQDLSNRTRYLYNRSAEAANSELPLDPTFLRNDGSRFAWQSTANGMGITQSSIADSGGVGFLLPLINSDTISIKVGINPGTGRGGLPATMPRVELWKFGGTAAIAGQNDTSGSVGVYETQHTITLTTAQSLDVDQRYIVLFQGEASTNAQTGLIINALSVTY